MTCPLRARLCSDLRLDEGGQRALMATVTRLTCLGSLSFWCAPPTASTPHPYSPNDFLAPIRQDSP